MRKALTVRLVLKYNYLTTSYPFFQSHTQFSHTQFFKTQISKFPPFLLALNLDPGGLCADFSASLPCSLFSGPARQKARHILARPQTPRLSVAPSSIPATVFPGLSPADYVLNRSRPDSHRRASNWSPNQTLLGTGSSTVVLPGIPVR